MKIWQIFPCGDADHGKRVDLETPFCYINVPVTFSWPSIILELKKYT